MSICSICRLALLGLAFAGSLSGFSPADDVPKETPKKVGSIQVPDSSSAGGESSSVVKVGNLIYAGTKTSKCFSDHFLQSAVEKSSITASRQLHTVALDSDEIYNFPMVVMNGEGEFTLLESERTNLRRFIQKGGFLLASAGCSSVEWNQSFRREMKLVFADKALQTIGMEHLIFHTATDVATLNAKHGTPQPLEGIHFGSRLGVLYSQDGLNDTSNTTGCCCCGGNEITNAEEINRNVLVYCLLQ